MFTRKVELNNKPFVIGTIVDVSHHVEREVFYRSLFEGANDAILILEGERVIECNDKALEMLGVKNKDEISRFPHDLSPETQPDGTPSEEKASKILKKVLSGEPARIYWRFLRKDGSYIDSELSIAKIELEGRNLLQVIAHDVTERLKMEERYKDLVEKSNMAIVTVDKRGRIIFFNENFCKIFKISPEGLKGTPFRRFIHPDDADRLKRYHIQGLSGDLKTPPRHFEFRLIGGDGKVYHVETSSSPIEKWGKAVGYRLYMRDISEVKKLREQLLFSQKMESIGRLAGGIAHDFNNILAVIMGRCELAMGRLNKEDPLYKSFESIKKAAEKGAYLTRNLLALSKKQPMELKPININVVLKSMKELLKRTIQENIELILDLESDIWPVMANISQMEQVIINLVVNAKEAMPEGGTISILTKNETVTSTEAGSSIPEGEYVTITVKDTGYGMTEDVRSKIFEPFFTTKKDGVGLGLSTVYGIVNQFGGHIICDSQKGKGTTFKIYLPKLKEKVKKVSKKKKETKKRHVNILIVEDDPEVRDVIFMILHSGGYKVMEAKNGAKALKFLEENQDVDLIITDVIMPGMSGAELAEKVKRDFPETKVLLISGYPREELSRFPNLESLPILRKPFSKDDLARKVEEILETKNNQRA